MSQFVGSFEYDYVVVFGLVRSDNVVTMPTIVYDIDVIGDDVMLSSWTNHAPGTVPGEGGSATTRLLLYEHSTGRENRKRRCSSVVDEA